MLVENYSNSRLVVSMILLAIFIRASALLTESSTGLLSMQNILQQVLYMYNITSQRSFLHEPIFRLLLKVAEIGVH